MGILSSDESEGLSYIRWEYSYAETSLCSSCLIRGEDSSLMTFPLSSASPLSLSSCLLSQVASFGTQHHHRGLLHQEPHD